MQRVLCALAILVLVPATCAADETGGNVALQQHGNHISVLISGKPFTEYWFGPRDDRPYVRPFFYPVLAPDGAALTSDQYTVKGGDHPHHQSMWIAQGDVNGVDHWSLAGRHPARQEHLKFDKIAGDTMVEELDWQTTDAKPMLHERRTMRFFPVDEQTRGIDFTLEFTPDNGAVTFGDTKEAGLIAIRMATSISAHATLTNSSGAHGEEATWGKPADWCDISGPVAGKQYGIAAMDSPQNPRHPTRWHVRKYGLLAANPFGLNAFDKAPEHTGDFRMPPGKTVTFRYRVIVHEGAADPHKLVREYQAFAGETQGRAADATTEAATTAPELTEWAVSTLDQIQSEFYIPKSGLYAEEIGAGVKPHPAWLWDASVQLSALTAAARSQPDKYLPLVKSYAAALRSYRTHNHDVVGLDVNPPPKTPDRYYDDNAWIVLSLLEAYDLTHDPQDLKLATDAYSFVMSGADDALGGGIYWHEDRKDNKHACSCGPAMLDALRLYQITSDRAYLKTATSLYDWTRQRLQDHDGLIFDSIHVADGKINKAKFTYNSATIVRAAAVLYQITGEKPYLDEAERVARACEHRWVRSSDGLIADDGKFGHKLIEAFCAVHDVDHDPHWPAVITRCVAALRHHRDSHGWYLKRWDATPPEVIEHPRLIDQASAARAFWLAARYSGR